MSLALVVEEKMTLILILIFLCDPMIENENGNENTNENENENGNMNLYVVDLFLFHDLDFYPKNEIEILNANANMILNVIWNDYDVMQIVNANVILNVSKSALFVVAICGRLSLLCHADDRTDDQHSHHDYIQKMNVIVCEYPKCVHGQAKKISDFSVFF